VKFRVLAGALGVSALLAVPAAASAAASDGPNTCFWAGPRGFGLTGGIHEANNFPDAGSTYWFARFKVPPGARIKLTGQFPRARYMSLSTYADKQPAQALYDAQIRPDAGSANPFRTGARRTVKKRAFTVWLAGAKVPGKSTTMVLPEDVEIALGLRIYVPDRGGDRAGGVRLPQMTLLPADSSTVTGGAACAAVNTPDHDLQTTPPTTLETWTRLIHSPGFDPAVAPATDKPFFERFFNGTYSFAGDFNPALRTPATLNDSGGANSNADTRYVYSVLNRRFGPVVVLKGKLPTTPVTQTGTTRMTSGQLRYWSICTNKTPVSGLAVDCAYDEQLPLRGDRRYTVIISRKGDRPKNATSACGVKWLDWGVQTESPEDPDYGLVLVRNMLAAPDFAEAAQNVKAFGDERKVMGAYLPSPSYTTKAAYEKQGGCSKRRRS
jgi:hypothetical protein